MTNNEIIKETRGMCRVQGMVLKQNTYKINNKTSYYIAYRDSGRVMFDNMTLLCAWETSLSDAIRMQKARGL